MSRTFCFGCSFTNYQWPTWADIVIRSEQEMGKQCWNFGMCGISNAGIVAHMNIADSVFQFTEQDNIYVVWTSPHRIDKLETYYDGRLERDVMQWQMRGSLFGNYNTKPEWHRQWMANEWSFETDLINNWTTMRTAAKAFDIDFQGHIAEPITEDDIVQWGVDKSISQWYNTYYSRNKSTLFHHDWRETWRSTMSDFAVADNHPDPEQHLAYVQQHNLPLTDATQRAVHAWTDEFVGNAYTKEQLDTVVYRQQDNRHLPRLTDTCINLNQTHGFSGIDGADIQNYVWLWQQISPTTVLNKLI